MPDKQPFPYKVMAITFLTGLGLFTPMFSIPPIEYLLSRELNLTHTQTSFLFTIPVIMVAVLAIPWGILADRLGFRRTAGIGGIILVTGSTLRVLSTDYASLLGFTFLFGLGFSMILPNILKMVSASVPRDKANIATGLFAAGISVGAAIPMSITVSTVLPAVGTFQRAMLVWSIPALISTIAWWTGVKEPKRALTGYPAKPGLYREVLRNKNLWLAAILLFLQNTFFYTWTGWAPALVMQTGAAPQLAATIASVTLWASIPTFFLGPLLSNRMGRRKPFIWFPSFVLVLPLVASLYMTIPMAWGVMALVGLLMSSRFFTIFNLPVEMVPREIVGAASGLMLGIGYTGALTGPLVGGRIFDLTGSLSMAVVFVIGITLILGIMGTRVPETGAKARVDLD